MDFPLFGCLQTDLFPLKGKGLINLNEGAKFSITHFYTSTDFIYTQTINVRVKSRWKFYFALFKHICFYSKVTKIAESMFSPD